ncbi:MAG: delta-60 repeat domain-containing protein, partial [Chloroflexia bacterium]
MNSNNPNPNPNLMHRGSPGGKKRSSSWLWLLVSLAVALLLALNPALSAFAAPGDLDQAFGTGGKVTTDFFTHTDTATAVAIQSNGKIVAAGYSLVSASDFDFALSRYNSDGTLDTTFDADGKVTTPILSGSDDAYAVAIQSDGKIVAAGFAYHDTTSFDDFALARYLSDGSLDTTFSGDGKVVTDFLGGNDEAKAVAIQSDGKVVAAGFARSPSSRNYFALARYNFDGNPDTSFGTGGDGKVTTDFGVSTTGLDMAIQADGKIVVAGSADVGVGNADFVLARYLSDGSLDTSFGGGTGKVTTDFFGSYDTANALAIQTNGKIVAAGSADHGANSNDFALARYLSDGSLDTTFSGNGKVFADFGGNDVAFA